MEQMLLGWLKQRKADQLELDPQAFGALCTLQVQMQNVSLKTVCLQLGKSGGSGTGAGEKLSSIHYLESSTMYMYYLYLKIRTYSFGNGYIKTVVS